jgi:hypothetical protein
MAFNPFDPFADENGPFGGGYRGPSERTDITQFFS